MIIFEEYSWLIDRRIRHCHGELMCETHDNEQSALWHGHHHHEPTVNNIQAGLGLNIFDTNGSNSDVECSPVVGLVGGRLVSFTGI